jgi:hypothetical protein
MGLALCGALALCAAALAAEPGKPETPPAAASTGTTGGGQTMRFGTLNAGKILFLGNSITLHGPAPALGGTYVDLSSLGQDQANSARSERAIEHAGVASHPGDRGMQAIATAILTAMETRR